MQAETHTQKINCALETIVVVTFLATFVNSLMRSSLILKIPQALVCGSRRLKVGNGVYASRWEGKILRTPSKSRVGAFLISVRGDGDVGVEIVEERAVNDEL